MAYEVDRETAETVVLLAQAAEHFSQSAVALQGVGASYAVGAATQTAHDAVIVARALLLATRTDADLGAE